MTWEEFFMRQVYLVASKSKDLSTQIGAVIVRDNRVISQGYNGIPMGVEDEPSRQERPQKYMWFEHGERNSIYSCARHGIATKDATMYTTGLPCADCARAIIQSGVKGVIVHKQWEDQSSRIRPVNNIWLAQYNCTSEMFYEAKIQVEEVDLLLNVETLINGETVIV